MCVKEYLDLEVVRARNGTSLTAGRGWHICPKVCNANRYSLYLHLREATDVHSKHHVSWLYASELGFGNNKSSLMQYHAEAFVMDSPKYWEAVRRKGTEKANVLWICV